MRALKTREELKELALDFLAGQVFTSNEVSEAELPLVFLAFGFMDQEQHEELFAGKLALLYEYFSKAGPRGFNGKPMFISFHYLFEEEVKILNEYRAKLKEAQDAVT